MEKTKKLYLNTLAIILIICSYGNTIALDRDCNTSLLDKIELPQQEFQIGSLTLPLVNSILFTAQSNFILKRSEDAFNKVTTIIKLYSPKFAAFLMSLPISVKNKLLVIWHYKSSPRSFSNQLADLPLVSQPTISLPTLPQETSWIEDFAKLQQNPIKREAVIATFAKSERELARERLNLAESTYQLMKALKAFTTVIANKSTEGINNITDYLQDDDITLTKKALTGIAAIIAINFARKLAWQAMVSLPELMRSITNDMIGSVANKFKDKMKELISFGKKAKLDNNKDDKKPEKDEQAKPAKDQEQTKKPNRKITFDLDGKGGIQRVRDQRALMPDLI